MVFFLFRLQYHLHPDLDDLLCRLFSYRPFLPYVLRVHMHCLRFPLCQEHRYHLHLSTKILFHRANRAYSCNLVYSYAFDNRNLYNDIYYSLSYSLLKIVLIMNQVLVQIVLQLIHYNQVDLQAFLNLQDYNCLLDLFLVLSLDYQDLHQFVLLVLQLLV